MSEKEKIKLLFQEIQQGNKEAFNHFFTIYYWRLVAFAKQYTKHLESAEEISSELFVKLWLKRSEFSSILNPEVYLYVSVKNACLNLIRSGKRQLAVIEDENNLEVSSANYSHLEDKELVKLLDAAVSSLPEQRKIIFKLIKEDGLKTSTVAQILGLSRRTVENQLYKAVKTLADEISGYLGYHPQAKAAKKSLPPALSMLFF
ncbi:MAG: RNA polymerase sigma-70 factor [Pedobacter sp.]|uniref:RNA polymerase sigma-70 factor n=1 Tax=Pedobacter sp. TaxID=1411316 RepID=UPI0028075149|nr:RNA polymerase sigma-70 factor [Pedobacter sp.]MDQ8005900.1 RNA polymerase sigma-70 factor [Pedobacter sp.]